ncbi:hypothetical protein [Winogradskyella sp.]
MKNYNYILPLFMVIILACEDNIEPNTQMSYSYNTNQQITTTESYIIDFEAFNPGDFVSNVTIPISNSNIEVYGSTMAFPNANAAMIFDSSNPTGNDFDLGTPNEIYGGPGIGSGGSSNDTALGNVLILSEDLDTSDPDDIYEIGAKFTFNFSNIDNLTLVGFDILDIEVSNNPTVINLIDSLGNIFYSQEVMANGDNSKYYVDLLNTSGASYMEIIMNSSGAVDNIALEIENEVPCVTCDSSIAELSFTYIGGLEQASIRFETISGDIIFENTVLLNEEFTIYGDENNGAFSSDLLVFINDQQTDILATDCSQIIGPGFVISGLEVTYGETITGGQLCPAQLSF